MAALHKLDICDLGNQWPSCVKGNGEAENFVGTRSRLTIYDWDLGKKRIRPNTYPNFYGQPGSFYNGRILLSGASVR